MDRATIQYGQLSLETDLLRAQQYAMVGIGKLFEAIVGTQIAVDGFATVPTSPASMSVNIGPGQVYQQANLEASPWSSLPADLGHTIVKQGISLDTQTQTFVAPTTVGFAQNYLIQVAYADADSGLVVRPYYNAANPSVPFNGPGNAGTQDSTVRSGIASLTVTAGVPATSGSQTTPTPLAGYAGLYVVTVPYGATTITAGNISLYPGAPFIGKLGSGNTPLATLSANQLLTVFQSSGTYTIKSPRIKITMTGGGGGGNNTYGGGAGAELIGYLTGLTVGTTLTVTVGAGGSGSATTSGNGTNGGDTVLSSGTQAITTQTAGGGRGVTGGSGLGGLGGTATNGQINSQGNGGSNGIGGIAQPYSPYGNGGSVAMSGVVINSVTITNNNGAQGVVVIEAVS